MRKNSILLIVLLMAVGCFFSSTVVAQSTKRAITGTVTSADDGKALQGASVTVKGTSTVTNTDAEGKFKIEASDNDMLVVTYSGYTLSEIKVGTSSNVSVKLNTEIKTVDEVVVIGYGTQKKSSVTGAVSKISASGLNQVPVARADYALQGKMAGVNIQTTNASLGQAPKIQIRGAASINASTSPLIVIDGYPVPTDLASVNMSEVQSIEVLKDAASAAIYGSRGANGVILITTKSGTSGKTMVSVNTYAGLSNVYKRIHFYNLDEWIQFVAADNNGVIPSILTAAKQFQVNTDPQDYVFQTGATQNLDVNVRGGSSTGTKFFIGASAQKNKGAMITNKYDRYSLRANVDFKVSPKIEAGIGINPSYSIRRDLPLTLHDALRTISTTLPAYHNDTTSKYTGKPVGSILQNRDFDPARNPVYASFGLPSFSTTTNNSSLSQILGENQTTYDFRLVSSAYLKFNITKDLSFRTSFGGFINNVDFEDFRQSWASRDLILDGSAASIAATYGQNTKTSTYDMLSENIFTYKKSVGNHDFNAIAGFSAQTTRFKYENVTANNFLTDVISTLNAGTITAASSTKEKSNLESALFRLNYAYNDKYLFSVASRWDGSSRFGANNKWGFFPSASAGWNISREKFMENSRVFNDLKIRGSYGATGNNNIGNYRSFATANPAAAILGGNITQGFNVASYSNADLGWERTFSSNIGFDAGLFSNKVRLTMDYYHSTTDKLLLYLPIANITGYSGFWTNQGKVTNKGLEYELTVRAVNNKDFNWTVTTVGTTLKNELKDFGGVQKLITIGDSKRVNYFLSQVGSPLVQFYGYEIDSMVSTRGSTYFPIGVKAERIFAKDQNKDGVITDADRVVLGTPYPKFIWGLTNEFKYKNIDVSFVLQGSHGASTVNIDGNYYENQFAAAGANAYLSYSPALRATTKFKSESAYVVQDASFVALRSLNIGYTLPKPLLQKLKMSGIRIYCSSNNLWYKMAKNYTSFNPEAVDASVGGITATPLQYGYQRGAAPLLRSIVFGINADF